MSNTLRDEYIKEGIITPLLDPAKTVESVKCSRCGREFDRLLSRSYDTRCRYKDCGKRGRKQREGKNNDN